MRQLAHCDDSTRRTHTRVLPLTLASQSKMSGERLEFCAEQLAGCSPEHATRLWRALARK